MRSNRVRELYEEYIGALEEWQIKMVIARLEKNKMPYSAWDDAMQELAILIGGFRFDPDKAHQASEKTILCRLIDKHIRMMARSHARYQAMLDRLGKSKQPEVNDQTPDDAAAAAEVLEVVKDLTPEQQEICQGLMAGEGIGQIAKQVGKHFEVVNRQVNVIRKVLEERGFDQWFE